MSQLLERVYASAPSDEVIIPTLEIRHPAIATIRTCAGFEDQTVTLEDGSNVTFLASGLDVSLPARNASGQQNLNFAIENVTGQAQRAIEEAMQSGGDIRVIYRTYLQSDLSSPAETPLNMILIGAEFQGASVQVTASYSDIISTAWPRERYSTDFAPGLRYIS